MSLRAKIIPGMAAGLLGVTLLSGCGGQPGAGSPTSAATNANAVATTDQGSTQAQQKVMKNAWGDTVIKGTPTKVVALDFFIVDMLVSIGVTPAGIAGTKDVRVPGYLKEQVPSFTDVGERKEPNLEVIHSIQPDLIIANPERAKLIKGDLEQIATAIALSDKTYQQILTNLDQLGEVFDKQAEAKKVRNNLEQKVVAAKESVKGKPSVLVVGAFEDEWYVWVADSFVGSLLNDAGMSYLFNGEKANTEGKADIATLTVERLADLNPDYIFLYGSSLEEAKKNPIFKSLRAVKENHVHEVEQDLWARARGPIAAGMIVDEAASFVNGGTKR